MQHQTVFIGPDQDQLLFAAAYKLDDGGAAALSDDIGEQSVRLLAAFIGLEIVTVSK
jgi:hypothetical protein